ncbi:hypothetical protein DSECCO2_592160 [anaerobic digester metagenome]
MFDQPGHGVGRGAVHADLAVLVHGHEGECRVDHVAYKRKIQAVAFGHGLPEGDARTAQGIDADTDTGIADGGHVHHVAEVRDVRRDVVVLLHAIRAQGGRIGHAPHSGELFLQVGVGHVLDDAGDVGVGRAARRRVVLEAAVGRGIVGGCDDDAVGAHVLVVAVKRQDGVGDYGRRRIAPARLDARGHAVGGEHFQGGYKRRLGQGVGVHAEKKRPGDALPGAVVADGLRRGQDVGLVEGGVEGTAAMARSAEGDALQGIGRIGGKGIVGGDEPGHVDEQEPGRRLAGQGADGHGESSLGSAGSIVAQRGGGVHIGRRFEGKPGRFDARRPADRAFAGLFQPVALGEDVAAGEATGGMDPQRTRRAAQGAAQVIEGFEHGLLAVAREA